MYEEIAKVFDIKGKPMLFAWGDLIYAPVGVSSVSQALQAHERIHGKRQLFYGPGLPSAHVVDQKRIQGWWEQYLADPAFRLAEEKLGHIAEFNELCQRSSSRSDRRRHLSFVSGRLASPLYRYSITKSEAREVLEHGYRGNP